MKRIATAAALVLALPLAAAAQGHGQQERQGQPMMEHGMMGQGMHGAMGMMMARPGPGMLLRVKGTLGLDEDQVQRLEAMHEEARSAMEQHREAARAARMEAHQAMMGETPDLEAFQAALEEAARHDVQATMAMARVHVQAADVLTAEQAATLETLMEGMHEMRGEGMHRMQGEGMGEGMQHRRGGTGG